MIKTVSLTQNRLFRRLYYRGKSVAGPLLVLYYMPGMRGKIRLGITVSTKIGHAVVRNRIKRQIKEAYRAAEPSITANGFDIVIVARGAILKNNFQKLSVELERLLKKAGLTT